MSTKLIIAVRAARGRVRGDILGDSWRGHPALWHVVEREEFHIGQGC